MFVYSKFVLKREFDFQIPIFTFTDREKINGGGCDLRSYVLNY